MNVLRMRRKTFMQVRKVKQKVYLMATSADRELEQRLLLPRESNMSKISGGTSIMGLSKKFVVLFAIASLPIMVILYVNENSLI